MVTLRKAFLCLLGSIVFAMGAGPAAAVAASAWLLPEDLSETSHSSVDPQVAVDARGDAIVTWNYGGDIRAVFRPAGGSWQAPTPIAGPYAYFSKIAMDPKGDAVAVWSAPYSEGTGEIPEGSVCPECPEGGGEYVVQAAVRPVGGAWQAPETISAPSENDPIPTVAIDREGNMIAAWGHSGQGQIASRPAGGQWQAPVVLDEKGGRPDVVFGPQGEAAASWNIWDGSHSIAEVAFKPAGGGWQAPEQVSETGRNAGAPQLALNAAGDAVAIWICPDCSGEGEVVQAAYKPGGGAWRAPVDISGVGTRTSGLHVGVDAAGNAVAIWERSSPVSSCCLIQAASKPAEGAWQAPTQLSVEGTPAGEPSLAVNPAGDVMALWTILDRSGSGRVIARTRPAGGSWKAPVDISAGGSSLEQDIAYDAHGDAVAVWRATSAPTPYLIVQAAIYDAAGPLLEDLSIPATGAPGEPLSFSVSPLDAWSGVGATSWDFGDGESAAGTTSSHTYAAPGAYTVTVTSEDALGNTSSASREVEIASEPTQSPPPPEPEELPTPSPPPTPSQPPIVSQPPTPSQPSFKVLQIGVHRDGAIALGLESPATGAFTACARMVPSGNSPARGRTTGGGSKRGAQRGQPNCPTVPDGSPVSFFGEGSATAPEAGVATLSIEPHRAALRALRAKSRWRVFVKVTFTPTGGPATSVTKTLEWP